MPIITKKMCLRHQKNCTIFFYIIFHYDDDGDPQGDGGVRGVGSGWRGCIWESAAGEREGSFSTLLCGEASQPDPGENMTPSVSHLFIN